MTVQLAPPIVFQSFLSTGAPNAFGTVATYIAGTSTPQATYIDSTQTTQNQNPTPLNALGQASIWLAANLSYKVIVFDALGNQLLFQDNIPGGVFTQQAIGQLLYPQTASELAASVTPINYFYPPGYFRRYGAKGDGTTDDTTAIVNALNSNVNVYGYPTDIYKYTSNIALPFDMIMDLQGAVLRPANAIIFRNLPTPDVTTNVTNGLKGSIFITVASTAGLAVGNIVSLQGPNANNGPVPFFWAQIKQIVGSVLTLDRPLPIDYVSATNSSGTLAWAINTVYKYGDFVTNGGNYYFCAVGGTSAGTGGPGGTTPNVAITDNTVSWVFWGQITCNLYNNSTTLRQRLFIKNGDVDGSLYTTNPPALGLFVRASTYRNVLIENLRFYGFNTTGTNQPDLIGIFYGIDCKIRGCTFDENVFNATGSSTGVQIDVQGFRSFTLENNSIMGSAFGCDGTACENFIASGNVLNGTSTYETYAGPAVFPLPISARGIKGTRCASVTFSANMATNYSTPLRTDQGIRASWIGNYIRNADPTSLITFTASVGGATSGTLTGAVTNGTYTTTFSDGEVRSVTITGGTAAAWSGALSAGTITTAWAQGLFVYTTNLALNGSATYCPIQRGYLLINNTIENCGGIAIAFHSGVGGTGTFSGRNICVGNKIIGCNGAGIYSTDSDALIDGNHIENWDRAVQGFGAIHLLAPSHTIRNNRFRHDTDATRWCISTLATSSGTAAYVCEGNLIEGNTANPMIQGGFDIQKTGSATITSGTTSIAVTPNVISSAFVMDATMVTLTPTTKTPTNTPRMVSAGGFGANAMSIQCDADPGASNLTVAYQLRVPQPFKL